MKNQTPEDLLLLSDCARGFASMATGATREKLEARGLELQRAAFDLKFGPLPPELESLSDSEILEGLGL